MVTLDNGLKVSSGMGRVVVDIGVGVVGEDNMNVDGGVSVDSRE